MSQHNANAGVERESQINSDEIDQSKEVILSEIEVSRHSVMITNINKEIKRGSVEVQAREMFEKLLQQENLSPSLIVTVNVPGDFKQCQKLKTQLSMLERKHFKAHNENSKKELTGEGRVKLPGGKDAESYY